MISKPPASLYEVLYPHLNIDADVCDPTFVAALPLKPAHATSNPRFIHEQVINPANKEMVEGAVKEMKGASAEEVYSVIVGTDCREKWRAVTYVQVARQLSKILPLIQGRVHAQTFPSYAYDVDGTVKQAKSLIAAFNAAGIPT